MVLNVVALAFLVLHVVTWFSLTPQAMDVRLRGRPVPAALIIASQYVGLAVVSAFVLLAGDAMSTPRRHVPPPTKRRIEPLVWLMFSGGGVMAAVFLPILVFLFAFAFPLGWVDAPDHDHLAAVVGHPLTLLVLFGMFVVMLVHSAHRFRYTLYDGLQIKAKRTHRGALLRQRVRRLGRRSRHPHHSWLRPHAPRTGPSHDQCGRCSPAGTSSGSSG